MVQCQILFRLFSVQDQEWRRVNEIDKLVTSYEPPEVLEKYYPGGIIGQTKDGYPVWIETLATADQKGKMAKNLQKPF